MSCRGLLFLLFFTLPGCTALFSSPPPAVVGTLWEVVELQGEPFTAPEGEVFTLQLQPDGQMRVYAGCNALSGEYEYRAVRGGEGLLRVGPFAERRKQCSPERMHLEKEVVRAMEGASRYIRPDAGSLSLRNPIQVTLIRFRARGDAR